VKKFCVEWDGDLSSFEGDFLINEILNIEVAAVKSFNIEFGTKVTNLNAKLN